MSLRPALCFAILFPLAFLGGAGPCFHRNSSISTRAKLADALGPCRFIEGRFTGGFSYARFDPAHPGLRLSKDRRIALRKLSQGLSGSTPEVAADRALFKLLDGDSRQAVQNLEAASAAKPNSAAFLSDLAAAYLADARINDDPYSRVKSLEAAENAVTLDPKLPEALFNRALALESLFLRNQARSAWDGYLKIDAKSGWAQEAKAHKAVSDGLDAATRWALQVQKLEAAVARNDQKTVRQIVGQNPQAAREYAEEKLLGDWAAAAIAKKAEEAKRSLDTARAIGTALVASNGEGMVAAATGLIDRAESSGGDEHLSRLAQGHLSYREGLESYSQGRFTEARGHFTRASALLSEEGSPFAQWGSFRLAVCEMQFFNYKQAADLLVPLHQANFKSLVGRSLWVRGLILGIQGKYPETVSLYRAAIRQFAALGEGENLTVVRSLVAECLELLGDLEGGWKFNEEALSLAKHLRNPARHQQILEEASSAAFQGDHPSVSLDFLQEALGAPSLDPTPAALYCLRRKALAYSRLQQLPMAKESIRMAKSMAAELPDKSARKSMMGDLLATEGRMLAASNPLAAIAQLTEAIKVYNETDYSSQLALLLAERARAYRTTGNMAFAENDLKQAVSLILSQRARVASTILRISYLEEFRSIFDDMVDLQVSLGRPDQALEYAESARSRALLESLTDLPGAHPIPVLATRSLQAGLPQHVALIEYQVLPTKLLTWVLRRDSIAVYQAEISQASLKLQVDQFRRKIQICSAALKGDAESRVLSALLIGKLKPALIGATALVIVPDGDLNAVPFSALPDGESGNYLVERYALSMAPSGRMYLSALAHKRHRVRALSLKVTAFGDPAFDRTLVDELVRLPKAKEEARKIASIYPRAKLSLDSEATRDQFFMALGNSDIVHFAGHAITNAKTPLASFLVLASAGADSGIVYASDLYKFRLSTSRLVVLSACSGLAGKDLGREGVESLARPFLAMGVPAVVASLWQVNDRPAGALLVEFHRRINGHASFGEALRKAQIAMLHSADLEFMSPAAWAGFQLIGAL